MKVHTHELASGMMMRIGYLSVKHGLYVDLTRKIKLRSCALTALIPFFENLAESSRVHFDKTLLRRLSV